MTCLLMSFYGMTLDEGRNYSCFCCDNLCIGKSVALEKLGKLGGIFSPSLWPACRSTPLNYSCIVYDHSQSETVHMLTTAATGGPSG